MLIANHLSDKLGSRHLQSRASRTLRAVRRDQEQSQPHWPSCWQLKDACSSPFSLDLCGDIHWWREHWKCCCWFWWRHLQPAPPCLWQTQICLLEGGVITCRAQQGHAQLCSPAWKCTGAYQTLGSPRAALRDEEICYRSELAGHRMALLILCLQTRMGHKRYFQHIFPSEPRWIPKGKRCPFLWSDPIGACFQKRRRALHSSPLNWVDQTTDPFPAAPISVSSSACQHLNLPYH